MKSTETKLMFRHLHILILFINKNLQWCIAGFTWCTSVSKRPFSVLSSLFLCVPGCFLLWELVTCIWVRRGKKWVPWCWCLISKPEQWERKKKHENRGWRQQDKWLENRMIKWQQLYQCSLAVWILKTHLYSSSGFLWRIHTENTRKRKYLRACRDSNSTPNVTAIREREIRLNLLELIHFQWELAVCRDTRDWDHWWHDVGKSSYSIQQFWDSCHAVCFHHICFNKYFNLIIYI